ncbi:MAG: PQQ-binding-like beta-propeller repeat protein [Armatimonadota bacterium]
MKYVILVTVLAMMLIQGMLSAADWPQFRGPNSDGISIEKGINKIWNQKPPALIWKTSMGDDGYAGASIVKDRLFIIDHNATQDIVRAIDMKTGKDVWTYTYPDAEKPNYGYSRATPTVNNGRVYTLGRLGLLNCFEAKSGKLIWSRNIMTDFKGVKPYWNYAMSIVIDGNKLIAVPGGPSALIVALDKTTGKTLWQGGGTREPGYSTPVITEINGKRQYVLFTGTDLVGVDANNGAEIWNYPWSAKVTPHIPEPIVIGNSVYLTNSYGEGCKLIDITAEGAKLRWENKEMMSHMATPILVDGLLYGNTDPGDLICIDPQTGVTKWRQSGFEKGPLSMVDGVLLVFNGKDGDLVMVDPKPDAYHELGRFKPLGGQSWTMPIVSNGKLVVRNKTDLACFDLK